MAFNIRIIMPVFLFCFGCGNVRLPLSKMDKDTSKAPTIRVGLLQQKDVVEFMIKGSFSIYDANGKFVARGMKGNRWQAKVISEYVKKPAAGKIVLTNLATNRTLNIPSGARLDTERFALFDVLVGEGFHWQQSEDRVYRGLIELLIDGNKKITVVNILSIESYLRGVVPSEMPNAFPLEALKAQAIAARSEVIKKLARHDDEGFDICATVHCQVYSGINREAETTNRAIIETAGFVLQREKEVVDAVYNGVCGGHTESNENVWQGKPQSHLRGVFDGNGAPDLLGNHLKEETTLRKWIANTAPVYCNTVAGEISVSLEYTRKYFRWTFETPRLELEHYIRNETGKNFGNLRDIVPLERGVSGRLRRVRIVGTLKSFEIEKELNIRRALSATTLYSACFVIEKKAFGNGLPQSFVFRGAGWGHGVGMCQTGAAKMALQGHTYEQIIKHYYAGVEIGKVY